MTAKAERLVNLTVALMDASRPLRFGHIRERVPGYAQGDAESARRMFERDKEDLRSIGVPVDTVALDASEADWGYRIDPRRYALPAVDLSGAEIAALSLAIAATGEESVRVGVAKLAARAPDAPEVTTPSTHVALGTPTGVAAVADPLVEHRAVTFRYRDGLGVETDRTVDPYGVALSHGAWYLVGFDHDRDDLRVFRIDRVVGDIVAVGAAGQFDRPDGFDIATEVDRPLRGEVDALLAVAPDATWRALRRGGVVRSTRDDGWSIVELSRAHADRVVALALSLGPDAELLEPIELRDDVVRRLKDLIRPTRRRR